MKGLIDQLTKMASINLAKTSNRRTAIAKFLGGVVGGVVGFTFLTDRASAAACDKCQSWYVGSSCGCSPPNGSYCSGCGSLAACPSGYRLSYAWGYSSTGCWCSSCSGSRDYYICCDCTRGTNPNTRNTGDCGCRSIVGQSGYCVQSASPI